MSPLPAPYLVGLLKYLLPGLCAAWAFYALTAFDQPGPFERVVTALILTGIANGLTSLMGVALVQAGDVWRPLGVWNGASAEITSIPVGFALGAGLAGLSNHDVVFRVLRGTRITHKTSFPSEWYGNFAQHSTSYVVIHLRDGRRLYGWPAEWPSSPEKGHFAMAEAEWLFENDKHEPQTRELTGVQRILVPAEQVIFVEFMTPADEGGNASDEERAKPAPQ